MAFLASLRGVATALALSAGALSAADLYLTPDGAGKKDGSSWENALAQASLNDAVNDRLKAGDRLMLGGGAYPNGSLKLATGGAPGKPKSIIGVDRGAGLPVFTSSWTVDKPDKGAACIALEPGASHFVVRHLRIKHYCFGVRAGVSAETPRSDLTFDDVDVEQQRHGYYLSHCDELTIENCDLKRYSKHGFRLDQGCNRVAFRNCTADCSEADLDWETKTELFPFGFTVNDAGAPSTKITFEDCVAKNNRKSNQGALKYTNGDGFVVEGNTQDVTFTRCRSFRNQDGGFDLKVNGVQLTDCVSTGNRRAFRIWRTGTLTNCFGGWSTAGLWCKEGGVTATRCTFHENQKAAVELDDKAGAPVVLVDCLISAAPKVELGPKLVELKETVVAPAGKPPGYAKADPAWDGTGPAMDAPAYPQKGYHSVKK
ncbi:MAG TPA: right-handed parallel beta-helix repeat-containing protein [Chthoniobacteraceae bacterium]|nr:right-handed parallel beta-helix repeat-containing protein [Chthoniobacteraceae bacterium]